MSDIIPYEEGGADGDEIDLQDVIVVCAAVDVVDHVFEDESEVVDGEEPG